MKQICVNAELRNEVHMTPNWKNDLRKLRKLNIKLCIDLDIENIKGNLIYNKLESECYISYFNRLTSIYYFHTLISCQSFIYQWNWTYKYKWMSFIMKPWKKVMDYAISLFMFFNKTCLKKLAYILLPSFLLTSRRKITMFSQSNDTFEDFTPN